MTHLMEQVGGWIEELIATIGYPGIVLVMAIENIFPPIPSEMVLPFAGALSVKGELNFWGAVAAGTAGSLIGAVVLYAIGYVAREAGVRRLVAAYGKYVFISEQDLDRGSSVVRALRRGGHLFRAAYSDYPQYHLRAGGLYADERRSFSALYDSWHIAVELAADLCRPRPRRELGRYPGLYEAV